MPYRWRLFLAACVALAFLVLLMRPPASLALGAPAGSPDCPSVMSIQTNVRTTVHSIPRVIHQTYKSLGDVPAHFLVSMESCRRTNPGFEHRFWNDTAVEDFFWQRRPDLRATFHSLPKAIHRADFFRYALVDTLGGFYLDVDVTCLRPFEELLKANDSRAVRTIVGLEAAVGTNDAMRQVKFFCVESGTLSPFIVFLSPFSSRLASPASPLCFPLSALASPSSCSARLSLVLTASQMGISRRIQFCQWAFASAPEQPLFRRLFESIRVAALVRRRKKTEESRRNFFLSLSHSLSPLLLLLFLVLDP